MAARNHIPIDYSHEVKHIQSKWLRNLVMGIGTLSFVVGIIGIFLPILPTTPFLLLTATCYAKTSPRFYNWLMNHYILGQYIRDWRSNQGIPKRSKVTAMILVVPSFVVSSFLIKNIWLKGIFLGIGLIVFIYLYRLPTKKA